jgi:4-amino-4-deoxy-L-arabinose transferase-like glycosyltransferase
MSSELAWNESAFQRLTAVRANHIAVAVITLFFLLQLIYINTPPLDLADWREADTTSVARNFDEESLNIFKPRIDIRRQYSGITGMEFPLYNFAIFSVNKATGFEHWHGRLVSAIASTAGLCFLYLLVRGRYQDWTAVLAVFFMASSTIFFYYSRTAQPDATMLLSRSPRSTSPNATARVDSLETFS